MKKAEQNVRLIISQKKIRENPSNPHHPHHPRSTRIHKLEAYATFPQIRINH